MRFEWTLDNRGGYYLCLYDGDELVDRICFKDYSLPHAVRNDRNYHFYRDGAFCVIYINRYSMRKYFDETEDPTQFGYNGTPKHTVEDIKRWCEQYLANIYIGAYEDAVKNLETIKRRAEWFTSQGYVRSE